LFGVGVESQIVVVNPISISESPHGSWLAERGRFVRDEVAAYDLLKRANGAGEHLLAVEIGEVVLGEGEVADEGPILQQMGRALAALGSSDAARECLERIEEGRSDEAERCGLLGRVLKDLAAAAGTEEERKRLLGESMARYAAGFRFALGRGDRGGAAYCGINAAALAVLTDDLAEAAELAFETLAQAEGDAGFYGVATRAEAALILGRLEEAGALYREAAAIAECEGRWADLASSHRQCRALCLKLIGRRDRLDGCFGMGVVAVFSGGAVGKDGWCAVREAEVRGRIGEWLAGSGVRSVFCGVRPGWEMVLLECAQERGVETHLVLPMAAEMWRERCVEGGWGERFEKVMVGASSASALDDVFSEVADAVDFSDRMVAARGALLAANLGFELKALVVGDVLSETAAMGWRRRNLDLFVIHPADAGLDGVPEKDVVVAPVPFPRALAAQGGVGRAKVVAVMHLHFGGYGQLGGDGFAQFQSVVLGGMAARLAGSSHPPVGRQGFGGDYLLVYEDLHPAVVEAMGLLDAWREALGEISGGMIGMPSVCLHAGAARQMVNPVLNHYGHEGGVVTRAGVLARHLPAGVVYVTETFAALSALEAVRGFRFEYAGVHEVEGRKDRLFRLQAI
jgi:hypothetical protein